MVFEQPRQMQTRGKNIVKRIQMKKNNTDNFWGNISNKLSTAISQIKHRKSSKTRTNTSQPRLITRRTKEYKNSATKTAKQHHKRQTNTYKSPWP